VEEEAEEQHLLEGEEEEEEEEEEIRDTSIYIPTAAHFNLQRTLAHF